jgi:hypothetical protein
MLEILALIKLVKTLSELAREKGRSQSWAALGVLMWFGGELIGFVIGEAFGLGMGAYLVAIGLAIAGAYASWLIVKSLDPAFGADHPMVDTAVEGLPADPNNPFNPPRR